MPTDTVPVGIEAACFASARALIVAGLPDLTSCLVPDVRMQGENGLDFQGRLGRLGVAAPTCRSRCGPCARAR